MKPKDAVDRAIRCLVAESNRVLERKKKARNPATRARLDQEYRVIVASIETLEIMRRSASKLADGQFMLF